MLFENIRVTPRQKSSPRDPGAPARDPA
jgi:hypothetical protein